MCRRRVAQEWSLTCYCSLVGQENRLPGTEAAAQQRAAARDALPPYRRRRSSAATSALYRSMMAGRRGFIVRVRVPSSTLQRRQRRNGL